MTQTSPVRELRLAVTVDDYDAVLAFYRDVFGLPIVRAWSEPSGSGAILDAGRATLELLSREQADLIDDVEVGRRVAGPIRLALEVEDSVAAAERLGAAGAKLLGGPAVTPWQHRNVRLDAPGGLQLTLFTVLDESERQGPSTLTEAEALAEAVRLARENAERGQRPFGALVARDGIVLGSGVNTVLRDDDPTAHAEVEAIRAACRELGTTDLAGATVFTSCEPCPMCRVAAHLCGIGQMVFAASKETAARYGWVLAPDLPELQHAETAWAEEPLRAMVG